MRQKTVVFLLCFLWTKCCDKCLMGCYDKAIDIRFDSFNKLKQISDYYHFERQLVKSSAKND